MQVENAHFDDAHVHVSDWLKQSRTYVTVHDCFHGLVYPVPLSSKPVFKANHKHLDSCD